MRATPPAKINLALHITGRRDDGYHLLDSLVVFAEQADRLTIRRAGELSLVVTGPFANGVPNDSGNLVMQAAQLLQRTRGVSAVAAMSLEKYLPHGGGIGGGSSDAATALRLLAELWQVAPLSPLEALPLGADVPVCLYAPTPCWVRGVGEIVEPAPPLPEFWLVLVNPGVQVATGRVFALYDENIGRHSEPVAPLPAEINEQEFQQWLRGHRNDLTNVVRDQSVAPVVGDILDMLMASNGCGCAGMSGSGSTCWGYFQSESDSRLAETAITETRPGWWVQTSRIGGSTIS